MWVNDRAGSLIAEGVPVLHPDFHQRVLEELTAPTLVVNNEGTVIYANHAMARLGGWDLDYHVGTNVLDYLHPDDVAVLGEAFLTLTHVEQLGAFDRTPWAPIHARVIAANGQVVPVVITGVGGLADPTVQGIIYDVRPAHEEDILRRGLTGLAQGEPIDVILGLIADMIALPPLGLDAAVLVPQDNNSMRVIGATSEQFEEILQQATGPQPWASQAIHPHQTRLQDFRGPTGERLRKAGYCELWHVAPDAEDQFGAYRIVAAGRTINEPATGSIDRIARANELAGVVLLRARADALLDHSATHDRLTSLANREGFHRQANELLEDQSPGRTALLFVDLDNFKQINDHHGHAVGDAVLETVAARLVSVTRSLDLVARLGGDEFVIMIGSDADRPIDHDRVQAVADRALRELRRDMDLGDITVQVTASIGAAIGPVTTALDALLIEADAAMYEAKRASGNRRHIVEI